MGFKKINKKNEDDFINKARGETSDLVPKRKKRTKTFLMYFTETEFQKIQLEAEKIGMVINQYIRFKIFT